MPATVHRLQNRDAPLHQYLELRELWRDNISLYVQQRFGIVPTWQQQAILDAILPYGAKVSVRSGHGIGKSAVSALVTWWHVETHDFAKVPCTAPTSHQLRDILWGELSKWRRQADALSEARGDHARFWLSNLFQLMHDSLIDPSAKEWGAFARTARKENPEALQGFHCFAENTVDVLTTVGWIPLEAITLQHEILCADEHTFETSWSRPSAIQSFLYDGVMYAYHSRFLDFCVTPNHQFVYQYRQCNKAVDGNTERWKWFTRPLAGMHSGKCRLPKTFLRPKPRLASDVYVLRDTHHRRPVEYTLPMGPWLEFLGWYLAEGYARSGHVAICQDAQSYKSQKIIDVIERLHLPWKAGAREVQIFQAWLARHLMKIIPRYAPNKRVPTFVFEQSSDMLWGFLDAFRDGDGTGERIYYTSSPGMADDLQRLILLTGSYSTINKLERKGTEVTGLPRRGIRQADYFKIREFAERARQFSTIRSEHLHKVPYTGNVSCLTVSGGLFYVRDRKTSKAFWTHNSENLLFVIDECSGVPEEVFEAAEGALSSPGARVLMLGNPTRNTGTFAASHRHNRGEYTALHFRSQDSPLVDPGYRDRLIAKWGEGSNVVRVRADGEFPRQEDDVLISLELTEPCTTREPRAGEGLRKLGVDVARHGADRTTLVLRQGSIVDQIKVYAKQDTMETVGCIVAVLDAWRVDEVDVDVIGLGAGVYDRLAELKRQGLIRCTVVAVNVVEKAPPVLHPADAKPRLLRDYLWLEVARWLRDEAPVFCAPDTGACEDLAGELASVGYGLDSQGQLVVEDKDRIRKRLGQSCDLADGLGCTFAPGVRYRAGVWGR